MRAHPHCGMGLPQPKLADVDDLTEQAFRSFFTAIRLHNKAIFKRMSVHGLHPGQMFCLHVLAMHGETAQRDLAETLRLSRPTVCKMLQTLEKMGAIERHPDPADQRVTIVRLTASGRTIEERTSEVAGAYVRETFGSLSESDRSDLARLLDKLADAIRRVAPTRADEGDGDVGRETAVHASGASA